MSPSLQTAEKLLQDEVIRDKDLLGVYSLEENSIRIYKDRAVLAWDEDSARYRERVLSKEEFENFKGLIAHYKADELPPFLNCRTGGCSPKELLMLGPNGGRRVFVWSSSPPPLFAELERTFADLRRPPSKVLYRAGKEVPGFEILFADERLQAITIWKNGPDMRLLTADKIMGAQINEEIEAFGDQLEETEEIGAEDTAREATQTERSRRQYENFAWHSFSAGALGSAVAPPIDVIPSRDAFPVQASLGQWKARAGTTEIRGNSEGLYKISGGKLTKIKTGSYSEPVITPDGRWVVATKYDDDVGSKLVRIDLVTGREHDVDPEGLYAYRAIAFVSSLNRILVGPPRGYYGRHGPDREEEAGAHSGLYAFLDPQSGVVIPARGEIRPLIDQTFRPLQETGKPFEFWVAIPNKNETVVGIYNTRTFNLKPLLKLPKIAFDSMDLWADSAGGKVFFVYEGHLLAAPIKLAP